MSSGPTPAGMLDESGSPEAAAELSRAAGLVPERILAAEAAP